jgi:hypothetical protein
MELVMELAGVDEATATRALREHGSVENAVDALLVKPVVPGEKYLPPPPKVDTGMTPEQEERCKKGRWLQDQVNAVFSVAHSKTRTQPGAEAPSASPGGRLGDVSPALPTAPPGSPQGGPEKMTLPTLQSETLP